MSRLQPTTVYRLGEELGRGALGRVVRVHDDATGAVWAGKILHASHRSDPRANARFAGEARLVAALEHPNLVGVQGIAEIAGERVLLMELVEGPSLAALLAAEGTLHAARVIRLGRGIAAGLAAAHRAGLVHRDLKPANILVAEGEVPRIVDFGFARAASFAGVDPDAFTVVGTPEYMAPEALDPLAVDGRTDLYALGCILFELLQGHPPYAGATSFAVLEAHREAPIPDVPGPPELARLVRWLLAKSPGDRPQSAAAALAALEDLDRGTALVPIATGLAERSACPACGAPTLVEVPVCFRCRAPLPRLEPGHHTLFVTGPGEVGEKLEGRLRLALLDFLEKSPALGLAPTLLKKTVPRLPFALAVKVRAEAAERLAVQLRALGLEVEVVHGGRLALAGARKNAMTIGLRTMFVIVTTLFLFGGGLGIAGRLAFMVLAGLVAAGVTAWRPWVLQKTLPGFDGPPQLGEALDRVAGVLPAMQAERHRDSLRAVVDRVLALRRVLPADEQGRIADDLARLVDLATVASTRVDELEAALAAADGRSADEGLRAQLRERDVWAARLLEVTGFLDALRARWAGAKTLPAAQADADLRELEAHIEGLEEVARL